MDSQFICISCWKEFTAGREDIARRGGRVVCPFCGYIQPVPSMDEAPDPAISSDLKLEHSVGTSSMVAEEIPWDALSAAESQDAAPRPDAAAPPPVRSVAAEPAPPAEASAADMGEEFPVGEEEHTDRVDVKALLGGGHAGDDIGFEEEHAAEPTPVEPVLTTGEDALTAAASGVMMPRPVKAGPGGPSTWHLKTPSGLTFKFTDPESLLGWKKKLSTYGSMEVSPDGERWVDFARFVREYEEVGDPLKAFILSESLSDADLPPRAPEAEPTAERIEKTDDDGAAGKDAQGRLAGNPQFTFRVKEEGETGWGRYLLFALVGLGVGAGLVLAILFLTGVWPA